MKYVIYILKLNNDKYYVGRSSMDNYQNRINSHFANKGAAWTRKFGVLEIDKILLDSQPYDETRYTLIYMEKYGIDNVRGAEFSRIDLSKETKKLIERAIFNESDVCYLCGSYKHFANDCKEKTYIYIDETGNYLYIGNKNIDADNEWLSKYIFNEAINEIDVLEPNDIDRYVVMMMLLHGVANVRGGSFSKILDSEFISLFFKTIVANNEWIKEMMKDNEHHCSVCNKYHKFDLKCILKIYINYS